MTHPSAKYAAPAGGLPTDVSGAERLLLDILDTVREPLLVLGADLRVIQANRAFLSTFEVEAAATIDHEIFSLGNGQWDIPPLRELLHDRLALHPQLRDIEVDHLFPGIGRKIMLVNAGLVSRGPRQERIILLAIEDVTERRFTEWRLAEHSRELERSNAALDEFATVASHDLQEPLRKIISFGERLEAQAGRLLVGDARHSLDRMLNAAGRMRTLVTDVLAYSQVTTRVIPYSPTDLSWVARDVVVDLAGDIEAVGGRVELGPLPMVEADPLQMRQLLTNLVGNALKYRRPDVPLVVRVSTGPPARGCVSVTVTDNGIGFDQQYATRIFEMFERLHGRLEYAGSGIGLAICRKIVERHGGTVTATSSPGQGATFTVSLPVTHATHGSAQ